MLELDCHVLPAKARVMLSGIGDDAIFCKDLEEAGYGCVTGVDFSKLALDRLCCISTSAMSSHPRLNLVGADLQRSTRSLALDISFLA